MIGLVGLVFNGIAALKLWGTAISVVAIVSTVASIWSWAIVDYRKNTSADPGWSANVNMLTVVVGFILLFVSFWSYT